MRAMTSPSAPRDAAAAQLAAWRTGDDQAFVELVRDHQAYAWSVAARILGDADGAADAVQEAFLRVVRHADRFDGRRAFRPWLGEIVRNLAIDLLRKRRPHADVDTVAALAAPTDAGPDPELRTRVAAILAELPDQYRIPLAMRELEGLGAAEVAKQLGVDYALCRWRIHEGRRRFRLAWTARFGEDF